VSLTPTLPSTTDGVENAPVVLPEALPSGVDAASLAQVALAVFVNEAGEGAEE